MIKLYKKKPVVVEAIRWDAEIETIIQVEEWVGKGIQADFTGKKTCIIPTLEGDHIVNIGDMIIRGVAGECYPCRPDIFEATYDLV